MTIWLATLDEFVGATIENNTNMVARWIRHPSKFICSAVKHCGCLMNWRWYHVLVTLEYSTEKCVYTKYMCERMCKQRLSVWWAKTKSIFSQSKPLHNVHYAFHKICMPNDIFRFGRCCVQPNSVDVSMVHPNESVQTWPDLGPRWNHILYIILLCDRTISEQERETQQNRHVQRLCLHTKHSVCFSVFGGISKMRSHIAIPYNFRTYCRCDGRNDNHIHDSTT